MKELPSIKIDISKIFQKEIHGIQKAMEVLSKVDIKKIGLSLPPLTPKTKG